MKFGLIGHPIEHSLSPALFKAGYDGKYTYELIETADFEEAYQRFIDGYDGINVTAPFKEPALRKADIISEECHLTGATNLLIKTPYGIAAYNSDFRGVRLMLAEWKLKNVLIVGLGGAGKAARAAAESLGYETTVMNRTQYSSDILPFEKFREEFRKADVIIYNLPVRIPEMDTLTREDFSPGRKKIILEANYRKPSFDEALIEKMTISNPEATYIDGRQWLLQQAVTGYRIFTGESPDSHAMIAVIKSK